jgi:ribosomal protein S12 methylthiotransferase accessory factor
VELKCFIALSLRNLEVALECNDVVLHLSGLSKPKEKMHRCLHQVLQFSLLDDGIGAFSKVLKDLYGQDVLEKCQELTEGKGVFDHLVGIDMGLSQLTEHSSILDAYQRLQNVKI